MIQLGDKVKDCLSDREGICTGISTYLIGPDFLEVTESDGDVFWIPMERAIARSARELTALKLGFDKKTAPPR